MAILTDKKYSFVSNAPELGEDTFAVVRFTGFEGISRPYEFNILLVSEKAEVDLNTVLSYPARFLIHREEGRDALYHGILREFEQQNEFNGYVFYRAVLAPRLWWLTLTHGNKVYLGDTIPAIVDHTLKEGGLASFDYEYRLRETYPNMDYICEYNESHFDFMSRWLEREGIYYYFDQSGDMEKVIFTDSRISHTALAVEHGFQYSPPSGLDSSRRTEVIQSLNCRQRQLPRSVFLKDYNYEKPALEIIGSADVDESGHGEKYIYGEHFPTSEEGNRLAGIRAEELLSRKSEFFGESTIPLLMPGYTFLLDGHYRDDFNREYFIEEVSHEGSQTGYLISGIAEALSEREKTVYYRNSFKTVASDVQYRPERRTSKPRVHGTINARVDAEGSGDYAELDGQGRYKVRLPFDRNDSHGAGKASHFIRMAQPYSGSNYGVHFPLHKGAEVLLTFIDGDPDRPLIAGAVPNPDTVSPVTAGNQAKSIFRDNYGNELIFDSTPGDEHIELFSPHHRSFLQLGKSVVSESESDGFAWKGGNTYELGAGNKLSAFAGNSQEFKAGMSGAGTLGLSYEVTMAGKHSFLFGYEAGLIVGSEFKCRVGGSSIEKTDSDRTSIAKGDNIVSAQKVVNLIGGAKTNPGDTTLATFDDKAITFSVGSNKNPDTTAKSKWLVAGMMTTPLAGVVLGAIFAALMSVCIDTSEKDKAPVAAIVLYSVEILIVILNVVLMVIFSYYGLKDAIDPVTHFDDPEDKIDSWMKLDKENGISLNVRNRKQLDQSYVKLFPDGAIEILSNPDADDHCAVNIEAGDPTVADDEKDARIKLKTTGANIEIQSGKSMMWFKKDGDVCIDNSGATKGTKQIALLAEGDVHLRSKSGDLVFKGKAVYATKGIFETKNIKDAG